jgi:tetratricopeptide (TPR) repeat protein
VAGLDEAHARTALAEMQDRLARGPIAALGVAATATAEDVRTAFLQLTKRYHPVRFGRMAVDIQKQANEVFLALRAAHDSMTKALRRPGHAGSNPTPSNPLPAVDGRTGQGLPSRPSRPPEPAERTPTPPGLPVLGSKPAANRPAAPPPPTTTRAPAATPRPVGSAPAVSARDEAAVLDLLQRQQWDQARSALHQLSARDPSSKRIQALVCYARGREAQLDHRLDDARVELQDALELDPDLQVAKTALTELFTRRK